MPIYEYQCKNCGYQFEELQKVTDKVLSVCPQCQRPDLQKLISHTSFKLKGNGWYETDFKKKKNKPEQKKEAKTSD